MNGTSKSSTNELIGTSMNVRWGCNMSKYLVMIAGIIIMCVPEDASTGRFLIQASIGLALFGYGVYRANSDV